KLSRENGFVDPQIKEGTIQINHNVALDQAPNSVLTLGSQADGTDGVLDLFGHGITFKNVVADSLGANSAVTDSDGGAVITLSSANNEVSNGNFDGPITFIKAGAGVLTLNGSPKTFTGDTIIRSGGTLKMGAANLLPNTREVVVGFGAETGTIDLNGFNQE